MTADRKRSTGPPPSAGVLARYAQAYAREVGVAEGRVRAWVAYMIMAGALERSTGGDGPQFIVKGGVALELRLRDRARATKDIDVVLRDQEADLADALEQALTGDAYQGFSFRRKGEPLLLDNGAVNMEFRGHVSGPAIDQHQRRCGTRGGHRVRCRMGSGHCPCRRLRRDRPSRTTVPAAPVSHCPEASWNDPSAQAGKAK